MEIPKVRFIYAYPFDLTRRQLYIEKNLGYYPSIEEIKNRISQWKTLWDEVNFNDRVISKITEITKSSPYYNLDCFVFGDGLNPMSTPFLIPIYRKNEQISDKKFIEILIHEILHIYLLPKDKYTMFVRNEYSKESISAQNHVIIYAFLEKIYLDLFKTNPLDFDRKDLPEGYTRAIEIVKEKGSENLISEYYSQIV